VFKDHLHVAHSWDPQYGLMPTKTKKVREVPIPAQLYAVLKPLMTSDGFVFSHDGEKPIAGNLVTEALYAAMKKAGIKDRADRNITFHSWRHWLNSTLRARGVADPLVRKVTGHATEEMTEAYTEFLPEDFAPVALIQSEIFG
jgi:integrase